MVTRYTQPVVQTMPGRVFAIREVPLFTDPRGKWVLFDDISHLIRFAEENPVKDFQLRVVDEKAALDAKLEKLVAFIATPRFEDLPQDERARMTRQRRIMQEYSDVLGERIACFNP